MARSRDRRGIAQPAQVFPAPHDVDRVADLVGDPGGHLGAGPLPPVWGWLGQGRAELGLLGRTQQRGRARGVLAAVVASGRASRVVAANQLADPVGTGPGDAGDLPGQVSLADQPDDLVGRAGDRIARLPVALFAFGTGEMFFEM